jgi:hypothetical protein
MLTSQIHGMLFPFEVHPRPHRRRHRRQAPKGATQQLKKVSACALLGVSGSASSQQPEVGVLGSLGVVVVTALGVFEGSVGVADRGVGPPAGRCLEVGPVVFEAAEPVAEPGELIGSVGGDGGGEPPVLGDQLSGGR